MGRNVDGHLCSLAIIFWHLHLTVKEENQNQIFADKAYVKPLSHYLSCKSFTLHLLWYGFSCWNNLAFWK